jgi:3' terminal RNA ribose 2'-O-methyltransferase Hen1
MFLTIATTHNPATDLGYLLHKHPGKMHSKISSQGINYCFFSEVSEERCKACLLMDIAPRHLFKSKLEARFNIVNYNPYVNVRPYLASSLMSVAIAEMFGTAMNGRSKERQSLADTQIPLEAEISVLSCQEGPEFIKKLFEPLGYEVNIAPIMLDSQFADWGPSPYFYLKLKGTKRLSELLRQLYILIPVCDNFKHYWIDFAEQEKIVRMGEGWLPQHPMVSEITYRSLKHLKSLSQQALAQLLIGEANTGTEILGIENQSRPVRLNEQRMQAVAGELIKCGVKTLIDLGCGEGRFLETLIGFNQFQKIKGMDVSIQVLERASLLLNKSKVELIHGSLNYLDARTQGFDACVLMEVIEHFDPLRLPEVAHNIFGFIKSPVVIVTTPNREFNSKFATGGLRHSDHRFEWSRTEFQRWCECIGAKYVYQFRISFIGEVDSVLGGSSQMGVFTL